MRSLPSPLLSAFILLTFAQTAKAAELAYKWKAGSTVRFEAKSVDHIDMSAMGMGVKTKLTNTSTFALKVDRVRGDGTAEGALVIERFKVVDDKGRVVGALSDLPKGALKNLVEIDRKGNFKFKEIIYMVVTEKGENLLVSAKVGPNGASGSAQAGGEKMTLHASFDPKTGQLSAGYSIEKVKQPAAKKKKGGGKEAASPKAAAAKAPSPKASPKASPKVAPAKAAKQPAAAKPKAAKETKKETKPTPAKNDKKSTAAPSSNADNSAEAP